MNNISEDSLIWSTLDAKPLVPNDWDFFWNAWNKFAGPSYLVKTDPAGNRLSETSKNKEFFQGLNIYADDPKLLVDNHWSLPFLDYKEIFPNILEDISLTIPWAKIHHLRLWNSTIPIPFHRDHASEPIALRSMIYDENKTPTFKVFHDKAGVSYVNLPSETNWFVYNNKKCLHGSNKFEGVKKIILLIIHTVKDKTLFLDHLKSSAQKYPDHQKYF